MKTKIATLMLLLFISNWAFGQTVLVPGDIAITGVNMDNPDQISIVFLVDITSGTQISITDNGWKADNTWRSNEGIHTWIAPNDLSAGTQIIIDLSGPQLSGSGDQVIIYQGANSMIAAINDEGAGIWQTDATSSNTSALPQNLIEGVTCVALIETNNIVYNRILTSGTKAELLATINNKNNWTGDNRARQTLSTENFTITDASLPVTLSSFQAIANKGSIQISWTTESEVNNLGFNLYRSETKEGDFVKIGKTIEGAGNSSTKNTYSYTDKEVLTAHKYYYLLEDLSLDGKTTKHNIISAILKENSNETANNFHLFQAYPNPCNPSTNIRYSVPKQSAITLKLYNMQGTLIKTLVSGNKAQGIYQIKWDGTDSRDQRVSNGIYIYKLASTTGYSETKKIILLK